MRDKYVMSQSRDNNVSGQQKELVQYSLVQIGPEIDASLDYQKRPGQKICNVFDPICYEGFTGGIYPKILGKVVVKSQSRILWNWLLSHTIWDNVSFSDS